jgi:hypothetical protein
MFCGMSILDRLPAADPSLAPQGTRMFAIPFFQTVLSLLFIGIWLLVGQIIATDRTVLLLHVRR